MLSIIHATKPVDLYSEPFIKVLFPGLADRDQPESAFLLPVTPLPAASFFSVPLTSCCPADRSPVKERSAHTATTGRGEPASDVSTHRHEPDQQSLLYLGSRGEEGVLTGRYGMPIAREWLSDRRRDRESFHLSLDSAIKLLPVSLYHHPFTEFLRRQFPTYHFIFLLDGIRNPNLTLGL